VTDSEDRSAIAALTIDYCWALDTRDWDALREVFLPDAVAELGSPELFGIEAIIDRVSSALGPLDDSQHMVSTHQIVIDGDRARSRCYFQAQHIRAGASGSPHFIIAGRYEDELVRTDQGWRIARRRLVPMWREGNSEVVTGGR
jgi:3-phenylpropionate/cinnamic acid dioxygenase small subunit